VEFGIVGWSVVAEHTGSIRIEFDDGIAPIRLAIVGAITGGHEDVAGCRVDHGSSASPNRGLSIRARAGLQQASAIAAKRVPYVQQLACLGVENGDVALVRRPIADVAARDSDDSPAKFPQRRGDFLP